MDHKKLQLENGEYLRIVNSVIDELVKTALLGSEFAICFFIIRKTWGFNKKEDEISLTQFQIGTHLSRPTIIKALKKLELVNMVLLAKGDPKKGLSNKYKFNKYFTTWKKMDDVNLVKQNAKPSKVNIKKLVKTALHTKDNTKYNTKDRGEEIEQARLVRDIIEAFGVINPACKKMYGNTSQRQACLDLIEAQGFDRVISVVTKTLPKTNAKEFFPTITTPHQLFLNWARLEAAIMKYKGKVESKNNTGRGLVE